MQLTDTQKRDRIRELNDALRKSLDPRLGKIMVTAGVAALPDAISKTALRRTASFDAFNADCDPHGEHDFGAFEIDGRKFFFKVDYYDSAFEYGSEDASDPEKTGRVLTLMLAQEY